MIAAIVGRNKFDESGLRTAGDIGCRRVPGDLFRHFCDGASPSTLSPARNAGRGIARRRAGADERRLTCMTRDFD
jgi:hypothetical protein